MRTAGIIAEYNPFHNGHEYHIKKTREAGYTHIVAVMSGNYTQRGEPACAPKDVRCLAALNCGADLVVELPLPWAVSSAECFARAGVFLFDAMGCVEALSFGSESGDLPLLKRCAENINTLNKGLLRKHLKTGVSFASAREAALAASACCAAPLRRPNDTLAIEYLRAIGRLNSRLVPLAVTRHGAEHDSDSAASNCASASFIRNLIRNGGFASADGFIPLKAKEVYESALHGGLMPFDYKKFDSNMLSYLRRLEERDYLALHGVSEGLENRIADAVRECVDMDEVRERIKTKRYAMSRIRRILLCAFLSISGEYFNKYPPYIRILGFNLKGTEILREMKGKAALPVITRFSEIQKLPETARAVFELESTATDLFSLCLPSPQKCGIEKSRPVIKLNS